MKLWKNFEWDCFIQSRGCVRMKNSDYILMFKSGHSVICSRVEKYLASAGCLQQLFKTYQSDHEGLLSLKREKIISNAALCKFGRHNKEVVWQSIRPLLEPLVTPETLKLHPIRELNELC
ncbi:hypothetical protein PHAVU_008G129200 [Phaseolus vulgaris]